MRLLALALWASLTATAGSPFLWHGLSQPQLLNSEREGDSSNLEHWRGRLANGGHMIVSARAGDEKDARRWLASRELIVQSAYAPQDNPYPGFISERIECQAANRPTAFTRHETGLWMEGFKLFSNERFALAGCRAEDMVYRTLWVIARCEKSGINYEIKILLKKEATDAQLETLAKGFACST